MPRLIVWIVLLIIAGWFWRRAQRTPVADGHGRGPRPATAARAQLPEPMVQCAECGAHVPSSDSVPALGKSFCSREHAQRHAAAVRS